MMSTNIAKPIFKEVSLKLAQVDVLPLLMIGTGLDSEIKDYEIFVRLFIYSIGIILRFI